MMMDKAEVAPMILEVILDMIAQDPECRTKIQHKFTGFFEVDDYNVFMTDGMLGRSDGPTIEGHDGLKMWVQNEALHRDSGPAVIWPNGVSEFRLHGELCRNDIGPVVIDSDGTAIIWATDDQFDITEEEYMRFLVSEVLEEEEMVIADDTSFYWVDEATGILHRENGPAVMWFSGDQEWVINGKLHRDGGPAVVRVDGTEEWYQHGKLHRNGGPAVLNKRGTKIWYQDGLRHRNDGPAIEFASGRKAWFWKGDRVRKDEYDLLKLTENLDELEKQVDFDIDISGINFGESSKILDIQEKPDVRADMGWGLPLASLAAAMLLNFKKTPKAVRAPAVIEKKQTVQVVEKMSVEAV